MGDNFAKNKTTSNTAPIPRTCTELGKQIIKVQKEDFDVFQALDMDSFAVSTSKKHMMLRQNGQEETTEQSKHFTFQYKDYGQAVPNYANKTNKLQDPPPIPPHLLHSMLNKQPLKTGSTETPELLPKPCHTLINHLYAMSIKDGVMTLGSTQRYRKKYVTTILYRPIPTQ